MLTAMQPPSSPLDSLIARIQALLTDKSHPGFGTLTTAPGMAEVETTMKPKDGEAFADFARRVLAYAGESPVVWTIQDRKIPIARVTRKLSE
jgi:hypothetical protein